MKNRSLLLVLLSAVLVFWACKNEPVSIYRQTGSVERLSPLLDEIIEPGVMPEIVADSFMWSEGPIWIPEQEMLLFSDIPQNSVFQWTEKDGLKLYLKPAGYTDTIPRGGESGSNGLLLDPEGRYTSGVERTVRSAAEGGADAILIGGSTLASGSFDAFARKVKSGIDLPVIVFPERTHPLPPLLPRKTPPPLPPEVLLAIVLPVMGQFELPVKKSPPPPAPETFSMITLFSSEVPPLFVK